MDKYLKEPTTKRAGKRVLSSSSEDDEPCKSDVKRNSQVSKKKIKYEVRELISASIDDVIDKITEQCPDLDSLKNAHILSIACKVLHAATNNLLDIWKKETDRVKNSQGLSSQTTRSLKILTQGSLESQSSAATPQVESTTPGSSIVETKDKSTISTIPSSSKRSNEFTEKPIRKCTGKCKSIGLSRNIKKD